jgi:sugar/nucleoside kinase (ribokinase family)
MKPTGLFIGRSVIDVINGIDAFPARDGKVTAKSQTIVGGGPALNAAITFAHLGGKSILYSSFGPSVFARFAREECAGYDVQVIDRAAGTDYVFPVSCVLSASTTGSRFVINTPHSDVGLGTPSLDALRDAPEIIMLDQFEPDAVSQLAPALRKLDVPIVLDAGTWKRQTSLFLDVATIPIVSATFNPPATSASGTLENIMADRHVTQWARTLGGEGVAYFDRGEPGRVPAIKIKAVDTLGAGDIFHGAFCFAFASKKGFVEALRFANEIAAESCKYPGPRAWMSVKTGQ